MERQEIIAKVQEIIAKTSPYSQESISLDFSLFCVEYYKGGGWSSVPERVISPRWEEASSYRRTLSLVWAEPLEAVTLLMELEAEFDLKIPDEVAEEFTTVNALVNYLASLFT